MILRPLSDPEIPIASDAQNAWQVFFRSQKQIKWPCALIFQSDHARLAGDLSAALLDGVFGPLRPEVMDAAGRHDSGWDTSDSGRLDDPRPFPFLSIEETLPAWRESIAQARTAGPLVELLVSRHFTALGTTDPQKHGFVEAECTRREPIERMVSYGAEELDSWTDAIGFCDLISLYLCSGAREPARFVLAHPAGPRASHAKTVDLYWRHGTPHFSSPVFQTGTEVHTTARRRDGGKWELFPLSWRF